MRVNKNVKRRKKAKKRTIRLNVWGILGILAAACLFVAWPYIKHGRFATYGTSVPEGYDYFCLDISHYNGDIVWDSLKVAIDPRGHTTRSVIHAKRILPVRWVVVKATEGEKMVDDRFQDFWSEAGRINTSRGAYHFFRSSKDPRKQAENYIASVKLRKSDLPPILDVETIHKGCTRKMLNDRVLTWLEIVEKHYGRKPIVYTSDSFARTYLSSDVTANYPLWIARYNEEPPRTSNWSIWQFTDKALVIGAPGYSDLSVIRINP